MTLWRFGLKVLSIDEMVGVWCFGCCQAHGGLPVGFLLLRHSVSFTFESLSLLHLLFISWFICSKRWWIDKLRVFRANTSELRVRFARHETSLSPPVKYATDRSRAVLYFVDHLCYFCLVFCYAFMRVCLLVVCWKGLTSWLSFVTSIVKLSLSHWYPWSVVVLDCIDSWSLPSFLPLLTLTYLNRQILRNQSNKSRIILQDESFQKHPLNLLSSTKTKLSKNNVKTTHANKKKNKKKKNKKKKQQH